MAVGQISWSEIGADVTWLIAVFVFALAGVLSGLPVALVLVSAGGLVVVAAWALGHVDGSELLTYAALPDRLWDGVLTNQTLAAIPVFLAMGCVLQQSGLIERALSLLSKRGRALPPAIVGLGALLGATTGVAGASVTSLGMLTLPQLLKRGMSPAAASGLVAASGTLGQLIPPSVVLLVLADQVSQHYSAAQYKAGNFAPDPVTSDALFMAALLPSAVLILLYGLWSVWLARKLPAAEQQSGRIDWGAWLSVGALLILAIAVLGSILVGLCTTIEAALLGLFLALAFATPKLLTIIEPAMLRALELTAVIFFVIFGAIVFSLSLKILGVDALIREWLSAVSGGDAKTSLMLILLIMFVLGFFFEFLEVLLITLPTVGPILFTSDLDPIAVAVLMALVLQTSFLTPPFGLSLFYLKSVAPPQITSKALYKGVWVFVACQLLVLMGCWLLL